MILRTGISLPLFLFLLHTTLGNINPEQGGRMGNRINQVNLYAISKGGGTSGLLRYCVDYFSSPIALSV